MDFRTYLNTGEKREKKILAPPPSNQNLVVHLLDDLTNITNTIKPIKCNYL
jgi:hypothetical protein